MAIKRFVDANILLHYILQDNKVLYEEARANVEDSADNSLVLTAVIVAEVIYILISKHYTRQEVAETLLVVMGLKAIEVEDAEAVTLAIRSYASRNLDFADCYILHRALSLGYSLATKDNKLQKVYETETTK